MADPTRDDDDLVLTMLHDHVVSGLPKAAIAQRHSVTRNQVIGALHKVKVADMALSGEPEGHVAQFYSRAAGVRS